MTTTTAFPVRNRFCIAFMALSFLGETALVHAVPPGAVDDNLTGVPVNQDDTMSISESSLESNDTGDGKDVTAVDSTSSEGAAVSLSGETITYNPTSTASLIALDSGDSMDDTFDYTLSGTDGPPFTDTATVTVRVNGVNDAPSITGMPGSTLSINDKQTTQPFNAVTISDPDTGENLTVTVTVDAANEGVLTNLNGFSNIGGGNYSYTGSDTNATTKLKGLRFEPTENRLPVGNSDNTVLTVTVNDGTPSPVSASRTVNVTSVNDAPGISGMPNSTISIDDDESATPFSSVTINDPDTGETVTVAVTVDAEEEGVLTNLNGFSDDGSGVYSYAGTATNATTRLRGLVFEPIENRLPVGESDDTVLSVSVDDGDAAPVNASRTVNVTSVNDPPILENPGLSDFSTSSGATLFVFSETTLTDDDEDADNAGDDFTATIVLSGGDDPGSIASDSFDNTIGNPHTYTITATQAEVGQAIQSAGYMGPDADGSFTVSLSVEDSNNGNSNNIVVTVDVTQPVPAITGLVEGQQLADNGTILPFASAIFNSFGTEEKLIEISLDDDAKGTLDILGPFSCSDSGIGCESPYSLTSNAVAATDAIQNIRFIPNSNRIVGQDEVVTFTIEVKNVDGSDLNPPNVSFLELVVVSINDAPTISSDSPEYRIDDDEIAYPFTTISIADVDEGGAQPITVTVSLIGQYTDSKLPRAGGGELSGAGLMEVVGLHDTYEISGTPEEVTDILKELQFTPSANRNKEGQRETVTFTISVDDGEGGIAQNDDTAVIVLSVNGAPVISGVPAPSQQPFPVAASTDLSGTVRTTPFDDLTVEDDETEEGPDTLTFTITLDDADKGTLSGDGFASDDGGTSYVMMGTPAEITAALQDLVYELNPGYVFPLDAPGLTEFTLEATDSPPTENTTTEVLSIVVRERNVAHIVTVMEDSDPDDPLIPGSLREAIGLAENNEYIVFDFEVEDFPVVIRLRSTLIIDKNLAIIGSGVDQLTISGDRDGDGTGDVPLFLVSNAAQLILEQLSLKNGAAPSYGGAIAVDEGGLLLARFCSFEHNLAGQYGGAIDVFEGALFVEHCLFYQNEVFGSTAQGGGAISVYTTMDSSIINSTFVENLQENSGSHGGGAIYAENADLAQSFNLLVEHCTFFNNLDAASSGSAILANAAGLEVEVRNNIFADEQGVVLDVVGGGQIVSMGGNIATDATNTTYTQGGEPGNVTLLDHATDMLSTDPQLLELADNGGATFTCALGDDSPALDNAIMMTPSSNSLATDQRGVWRDATPDIGAFEAGMFKRVNINELYVDVAAGEDPFIEFYNPRDSETLNMQDLSLWVDGIQVHTFGDLELIPGAGFAWTSTVDLEKEKGTILLRNAHGQRLLAVAYVATFSDSLQGGWLDTNGQSMTRYPRYEGGFLSHQRVVERVTGVVDGDSTSPGYDVDGAPLTGGNAPPIAVSDVEGLFVFADEILDPDVLANDVEFDRTDTLKVTEVMPLSAGNVTNQELAALVGSGLIDLSDLPVGIDTTVDNTGVTVTISEDGQSLTYDPTESETMRALSNREMATDVWAYTILDYDADGMPHSRGDTEIKKAENIQKATTIFTVSVTGVNEAPEPLDDLFQTEENQALRLLGDTDLLAAPGFDFGDIDSDYQDFDAQGNPVTLLPQTTATALLDNDDDIDSDDDKTTLLLAAVHTTAVPGALLETTSDKGASVVLDVRADRRETHILYDPRTSVVLNALSEGETTLDSFYYSVFDKHGARGIAQVTVEVTGVNDVPTAMDDVGFVTSEDSVLSLFADELLANDTDPDGDAADPDDSPVIMQPFQANSNLGAALAFDGSIVTYDPTSIEAFQSLARNEGIVDSFAYTMSDEMGGTDQATVFITVLGRNDAPDATDDILGVFENEIVIVGAGNGLLSNDKEVDINGVPPDDQPWVLPQYFEMTPLGAELEIYLDGSFSYDANSVAIDSLIEGEIVSEIFPYAFVDNSRSSASDDNFRIAANREDVVLPVLANDAVVGASPSAILGYSEDPADSGMVIVESPHHSLRDGLLILIEGYAGTGDYNGVHPVNIIDRNHFSVPVAFADNPLAGRGYWLPWIEIADYTLPDQGGALSLSDGQTLFYTPPAGFYGEENFSYTIRDGVGGQDVAMVTVEVVLPPLNGILSSSPDRFRIGMGETDVEVDVLANDHTLPAIGSDLTITEVQTLAGAVGTLTIVHDGKLLSYAPPSDTFTGEESFSYSVTGGGNASSQSIVTIEVIDRTGMLSGNKDYFYVVTGSTDNELDVLANDPNLPSFPVSSSLVDVGSPSSGGQATIVGDKISYTPPASPFIGTETFAYTARDTSGGSTVQSVDVQVVADTVDFHAQSDHYTVSLGADPLQLPVLANDGVVNNHGASLSIVNLGLGSQAPTDPNRVKISADSKFIEYTLPSSVSVEVFSYETSIGGIERREATITVNVVENFSTPPSPIDDFFHVARDAEEVSLNVLQNDIPLPEAGWTWKVTSTTEPNQGGTVTIEPDSLLTYTPVEGFFGTETFAYTIADDFGVSEAATVTVKVGNMLTGPDQFVVLQNSLINPLPVLVNDDLLDRYASNYMISVVGVPDQGGTVGIGPAVPGNFLLYTPSAGFLGEETFSYWVKDKTGETIEASVTMQVIPQDSDRGLAELHVVITGMNDVPILAGILDTAITDKQSVHPFASVSVTDLDEGEQQELTVTVDMDSIVGSVSAPDMNKIAPGTYQIIGTPAEATEALQNFVFTPDENSIDYLDPGQGDIVFSLSIDDGYVADAIEESVTITVTPVNDAPVLANPIVDRIVLMNSSPRAILLPPHFEDADDAMTGGELTWSITGNSSPPLFNNLIIDVDKQHLLLDFASEQSGVSDIAIRATDRGGLYAEAAFSVFVQGPPVISLEAGETKPPAASFIAGSQNGFRREYHQAFRVVNDGPLVIDAFIVHVSDLNLPVDGITLVAAEHSTDEMGTPGNFLDDISSATGVTILQKSTYVYAVKYDVPILPGESLVVHLIYSASTVDTISIRPTIELEITTRETGKDIALDRDVATGEVYLSFNVEAGRSYRLEYSSDLKYWNPWLRPIPLSDFDRRIDMVDDGLNTDIHPSQVPLRFYRLVDITTP